MKILINTSLFKIAENSQHLLNLFLHCGGNSPHAIITPTRITFSETGEILSPTNLAEWTKSISPEHIRRSIINSLLDGPKKATTRPHSTTLFIDQSTPCRQVKNGLATDLQTAVTFLKRPLRLYVENNINDANFLFAICKPEWSSYFRQCIADNHFEIYHCGGDTISQLERLDHCLKFRATALFDSDGLEPAKPSTEATRKIRYCTRRSIPFHCLKRRMIENYLPDSALEYWANREPHRHIETGRKMNLVRQFLKMSDAQKHHFNRKHGFTRDRDEKYLAEPDGIFHDLPAEILTVVKNGISSSLAEEFSPPLHESWQTWLDNDNQREETTAIVEMIVRAL